MAAIARFDEAPSSSVRAVAGDISRLTRDFRDRPIVSSLSLLIGPRRAPSPVLPGRNTSHGNVLGTSVMLTAQVPKVCPRRPPASETPRPGRPAFHPLRTPSARSGRVPRESLDAAENLPKEASRQVAFGESQGEVPGMPDEASARLEQPLLETR